MKRTVNTLVIGSGAAGLAAALRLKSLGVDDVLLLSEGLNRGTSINTGSDKQTYYKLGIYGAEPDSPVSLFSAIAPAARLPTVISSATLRFSAISTPAALTARISARHISLEVYGPQLVARRFGSWSVL